MDTNNFDDFKGKTIKSMKVKKRYDVDEDYKLIITFTDDTCLILEAKDNWDYPCELEITYKSNKEDKNDK